MSSASDDGWGSEPPRGPGAGDDLARVVVRPLGHPLPIGLLAFSMGSFIAAGFTLGWFPAREQQALALVLLGFAFPLELLPVPFALLARDSVAATSLAIFSGQWLVTGLVALTSPVGANVQVMGGFSLAFAALIVAPAIAAAPRRPMLAVLLLVAAAQSVLSGIAVLDRAPELADAAAIVGLFLAAAGVYAAVALLLENAFKRPVLPITRRRAAQQAIQAPLPAQVEDVAFEPGVRKTL